MATNKVIALREPDPNRPLSKRDRQALRRAIRQLEQTSFLMRLANLLGTPVEEIIERLPPELEKAIREATLNAMKQCLDIAIAGMKVRSRRKPRNGLYKAACTASGFFGGFFGTLALTVELPVSTGIMLRSIADIARSEGENLSDLETQLACLMVFALGGRRRADDQADIGYFAVRTALARSIPKAVNRVGGGALARQADKVLSRLTERLAVRFGDVVAEKVAAQIGPVIGAIGGGAVNLVFIDHFQDVATGHFTVRRLERKYGRSRIEKEYERERRKLGF